MLKHRATESATPTYYYYALNSRSDVVGLYNSSGAVYAKYTYDPWGNITSVTNASGTAITDTNNIAHTQPFGYRSYYYDTDSKFYYLQSRYYDPVTHRFVNADDIDVVTASPTALTDKNLYSYCDNNPIVRIDVDGEFWEVVAVSAAIGFGVGFISSVAADLISGNEVNWGAAFASGAFGALSGALAVLPIPTGAFIAANAAISGLDSAVNQGLHNGFDNINYGEVALDATIGAVASRKGPSLSKGNSKHISTQTKSYKKKISSSASRHSSARRNASKYYQSQTRKFKNNYYKDTAKKGFFSIVANTIVSWFKR